MIAVRLAPACCACFTSDSGEKIAQPPAGIGRGRAVVFNPVAEHAHARLKVRVIKSVVRAGIDNESTGGPSLPQSATLLEQAVAGVQSSRSPMRMSVGISGRAAVMMQGGLNATAARNCRSPRWVNNSDDRARHREGQPAAGREADRGHALRIDESLAAQENEGSVGVRPAPREGGERGRCAGVFDAARRIAVDEQEDIAPPNKIIGQLLLGRLMHPAAAVQSDHCGERPRAIGPRELALDALAHNEPAGNEPLGCAVECDALQRRGRGIGRERAQNPAERQRERGYNLTVPGNGVSRRLPAAATGAPVGRAKRSAQLTSARRRRREIREIENIAE